MHLLWRARPCVHLILGCALLHSWLKQKIETYARELDPDFFSASFSVGVRASGRHYRLCEYKFWRKISEFGENKWRKKKSPINIHNKEPTQATYSCTYAQILLIRTAHCQPVAVFLSRGKRVRCLSFYLIRPISWLSNY